MTPEGQFLRLIVAGVDGSPGARTALEWAAELARTTGADVLAVHVLTYNQELLRDLTPDTMHTWRRDVERDLRTTWAEPLATAAVEHRTLITHADSPAEGLLDVSDRERADLLIVGTKGHGSLAGRVLGSTSYKLTRHARQPVLVIPPDWTAGRGEDAA